MKQKIFNFRFAINLVEVFALTLIFSSCCEPLKIDAVDNFVEKYQFNVVGIIGEKSDKDYIEIWYSEAADNGINKIVHKWVKPPIIIGGHYSYVSFDSLSSNFASHDKSRSAITDYSSGGSHFMKIQNHGNKPIEYFIAGTQKLRTYNYGSKTNILDICPRILYNNIPIYYMLFPEKIPKHELYTCSTATCNKFEKISFNSSKSFNIEEIMKLYRAEYNNSLDTVLHYMYLRSWEKLDNKTIRDNKIHPVGDIRYNSAKFYGIIPAGESVQSSNDIPFISHVCGSTYCDAIKEKKDN